MTSSKPLTASSSIAEWLGHPSGGPLIRGLLAQSGTDASRLDAIKQLPLQQLVVLSQGQLSQETVDGLVLQANGGVMPDESERESTGWRETITPGRFAGQTVIVGKLLR